MDILKRLIPGLMVVLAAIAGYSYGLYSHAVVDAAPKLVIDAADPPGASVAAPPQPECPLQPSPSVAQLEQAAYTFAKGFEQLESIAADVKAIRERLEKPPAGWTAVVLPSPATKRATPSDHQWLGGLLK